MFQTVQDPRLRPMTAEPRIGSPTREAANPPVLASAARKVFEIGQQVKVKRSPGKPGYDDGVIYDKNPDGSYQVEMTNGTLEKKVLASRITIPPKETSDSGQESKGDDKAPSVGHADTDIVTYRLGEKVEARREGGVRWEGGQIISSNSNGTYDIRYNEGGEEKTVNPKLIRKLNTGLMGQATRTSTGGRRLDDEPDRYSAKSNAPIQDGSKVEANYRGRGKWYPGKVTRDRGDGTFDISYDDGESEIRVKEDMIRLLGGGGMKIGRAHV